MFHENRFWNRSPDGIVINKYHRTLYILEFKRSSGRNKDFLRVKEDEANEQHRSIIEALRVAAPEDFSSESEKAEHTDMLKTHLEGHEKTLGKEQEEHA